MYIAATIADLAWINKVLLESELYWAENRAFEAQLRAEFVINETRWHANDFFIVKHESRAIGFFGFENTHLNYMYLEDSFIGKGLGSLIWSDVVKYCQSKRIKRFTFECSHSLCGYYEHMGARQIGSVTSYFGVDRMIPKYEYIVEDER